jgi:predicted alpha/beta hydrolase family esterase
MKTFYIIHRWGGTPESDWYPWLKVELEKLRHEVFVLPMPNADVPVISEWMHFLKENVGVPDENTLFIGHSIGCQTIMRYFETLPENSKVGGTLFVAGWFKLDNLEDQESEKIAMPWIETPIDFEKVKNVCPNISVLLSSDEPYGYVEENKKVFEEKLSAEVIVLPNRGHFTEEDGILKIPEILDYLK